MGSYADDARVFKALCDENRLRILEILRGGEKCACVLLSDLHIGIFIGAGYLERVAAAVNRLEPELVVISGDLFDGYLPADDDQLGRAAGALRKIRAPGASTRWWETTIPP